MTASEAVRTDARTIAEPARPGVLRRALRAVSSAAVAVLVAPIWLYQRTISPRTPASCKFHPTCSSYAVGALRTHGPVKGSLLAVRRIGRCHPWQLGGIDPVPPRGSWTPDVDLMGRPINQGAVADEELTRVHH